MKMKKIPMRMCVVSREKYPKNELIRVVKNNLGEVFVDDTGKKNGKGAYLKKDIDIINKARQTKVIDRFLEIDVPDSIYDELISLIK